MTAAATLQCATAEARTAGPRARAASERELDLRRSADSVAGPRAAIGNRATIRLMRKCGCGGGCSSRLGDDIDVQKKLVLDTPGDRWETEADQVADRVVASPTIALPRVLSSSPTGRAPAPSSTPAAEVGDSTEDRIRSRKGRGSPLPIATRTFMERRLQSDLSPIRVHTDAAADALSTELHSYAFTSGSDIFFANGQFRPASVAGQRLLAHELVHTVQQGTSRRLVQRTNWGDDRHSDIQERLRRDNPKTVVTEAPIPGAAPSKNRASPEGRIYTNLAKVGFADVYISEHPSQTVSGVRGTRDQTGFTNLTPGQKADTLPKHINFAPHFEGKKWTGAPGFPVKFWIGEIKPLLTPGDRGQSYTRQERGALKRMALGQLQPRTLIEGFTEFVHAVYKDPTFIDAILPPNSHSPSTFGEPIDFTNPKEITIPPEVDYRNFDHAVQLTSPPADIPLHRNTNYGPNGHSRTWIFPSNALGLLWYFDLCHPFPTVDRNEVTRLLGALNVVRAELTTPATGAPKPTDIETIPRKRKPGSPPLRVQRKATATPEIADPKTQTKWVQWRTHFSDWNNGSRQGGKQVAGAEVFLKSGQGGLPNVVRLEIDKKVGSPRTQSLDEKNLATVSRWSKSGYVFGWLRFTFGWVFAKVHSFFAGFINKIKELRNKQPGGQTAVGWEAKALAAIKILFFDVGKEFARSAYNLVANCVSGVIGAVFTSALNDIVDDLENNEYVERLKGIYQQFENIHKKFVDTFGPIIAAAQKALDTFEQIVSDLRIFAQIERALRLLVEVISCLSPPALGCLWGLVAQVAFEEIASEAIKSDLFTDRIARPAAKRLMEGTIGKTLRGWLGDLFKGIGLGTYAEAVPDCNFGGGLPSSQGGDIATSFAANDPKVAALRQKIEGKYPSKQKMMQDLQRVLKVGDKPATPEQIEDLLKSVGDTNKSPDEIQKILKPPTQGAGKGIDLSQAVRQLEGTPPRGASGLDDKAAFNILVTADWSKVKPGQNVVDEKQSLFLLERIGGERLGAVLNKESTGRYRIDSGLILVKHVGLSAAALVIVDPRTGKPPVDPETRKPTKAFYFLSEANVGSTVIDSPTLAEALKPGPYLGIAFE